MCATCSVCSHPDRNTFLNTSRDSIHQVYFTWVIRDFGSAEWFHSLLQAIEEQDTQNRIEINIYLTAKIKEDDMNNIIVHDVGAEKDAITSLRAPTHFGRPNWDRVFSSIAEKHPETDVGVVRTYHRFYMVSLSLFIPRSDTPNLAVLLRPRGALAPTARHVEQVLKPQRHALLLRQRYAHVLSLSSRVCYLLVPRTAC